MVLREIRTALVWRGVAGSTPRENESKCSERRASRVHDFAHGFESFEMVE